MHTCTHTLGFQVLCGHSIDIMIFIQFNIFYSLNLPLKENLLYFNIQKKHLRFRNCFPHADQKNVYKVKDLAIFVGTYCPHNIGFT